MTLERNSARTPKVILAVLWNLLLAAACVWLSITVFGMNTLTILGKPTDLGKPVQNFVALIILIPTVLAVLGSFQLLQHKNQGRYFSLMVNVIGFALSLFALLGSWGIYNSYEHIVDGIMSNGFLTLGFALAYFVYWIAGRLAGQRVTFVLERTALLIAGLTLISLLLSSNILGGASYVLSQYGRWQTWLLTGLVIVFLFFILQLLSLAKSFGESPDQRNAWQGWFMLAPNIIGFLFFFAAPLLLSFYLSFTDSTVGRVPKVIGLSNYANLVSLNITKIEDPSVQAQNALPFGYTVLREFKLGGARYAMGAKDRLFWISLGNTLLFCLMLLPLAIIPALGMSLILNSSLPGMQFFRALYFLPSIAAVVGTALIWRWLYTPTTGYISYALSTLSGWFGFADPEIEWLSDPRVVLFSVVLLAAWQVVGYNIVLFLAGLQGVPRSLYEASKIDGANTWQRFMNVTLPMIAPTTFFVVITTMVTGLQVFNEPYALFPSRPIPENATTLVYYLYTKGFGQFQFGYASSVAWVLFFIIFTFTFVQFRLNRSQAYA
jgi:ABC-type sugar transport system permease subunit